MRLDVWLDVWLDVIIVHVFENNGREFEDFGSGLVNK